MADNSPPPEAGASTSPAVQAADSTDSAGASSPAAVYLEALSLLKGQTKDPASAQQALEATRSEEAQDAESWATEAAIWLACTNELAAEQKAMGEAMQVSLSEAEAQKAKQVPIHQLSDEHLELRYSQSGVLKQLQIHVPTLVPGLWQPPPRHCLLDLLELEMKACKWYPSSGTYAYMNQTGENLATRLSSISLSLSLLATSCPDAVSRTPDVPSTAAVTLLKSKVQELESVLYAMPETSGAAPKCFVDLESSEGDMIVHELPRNSRPVACVDLV